MEVRDITEDRFIECMAIDFPDFKITKSNLTHLTSQFVMSFYSLLLRNMIELNNPDEVWNVTEDQRNYINSYHPEAVTFGQHVLAHNLHAIIKYVFNHLSENGSEFVYSDILFPENTPRRSFVFMALMLNFYWYSSDFAEDLNSDITACLKEVEVRKNLKQEKEKLLNRLKELEAEKCQYAESYKDKKRDVMRNTEANQEKEIMMKELLTDEEEIKKNLDKVEEEEQKLQEAFTQLQNEKKYLESLVVSNEEQIKNIHENHVSKKDECVKKMKILEEQVKAASSKLIQSNQVLEMQQKLNHCLKEEKLLPNSQGKHKGFQNLYDSISSLLEKKKILIETESSFDQKISEARETMAKLKNEYSKFEAEQLDILAKGKEKDVMCKNLVDEYKKSHTQTLAKIREDSEQVEEIEASFWEFDTKCTKLEKDIDAIDSKNRNIYNNYAAEMKNILESVEMFSDIKKKMF